MMRPFQVLKSALTHTTFESEDLKTGVNNMIDVLHKELYEAGYDPGTDIETATDEVEEILNLIEEPVVTENEDDDEEFEGLGEPEEE